MGSNNIKRSIVRNGQKTSVSLEKKEFWDGLREIAASQRQKLTALVQQIDQDRDGNNLSSAIRVFVFSRLRVQAAGATQNDRAPSARSISHALQDRQ
jgi:predicted DNA-binding ribbon-helix-helix protein